MLILFTADRRLAFVQCLCLLVYPTISTSENFPPQRDFSSVETPEVRVSTHTNLRLSEPGSLARSRPTIVSRSVCIEGYGPAAELANWLAEQIDLEELSLIGIQLTNADVQAIARLPRLSRLDLRGCAISRDQLAYLRGMKSLKELDLRGTVVLPVPAHV